MEEYRRLLEEAPSCFDFLVASAARARDLSDPSALGAVAREIVQVLAQVPNRIERARYVGLLAERLGVEDALMLAEIRDALWRGARESASAAGGGASPRSGGRPERAPGSSGETGPMGSIAGPRSARSGAGAPLKDVEIRFVRALVENEAARSSLIAEVLPADLEGFSVAGIVMRVGERVRSGAEISYQALAPTLADRDKEVLARIGVASDPPPTEEEAAHCLETMRRSRLVRERDLIQKEMERATEPVRRSELMRRKIDLSRRIDALS